MQVKITMENGKIITVELDEKAAPKTVANFVSLVRQGFYDGLIFHRVIAGFMIQGGGYDRQMRPRHTAPIPGEFQSNGFSNPLKHTRGVLSMARTNDPNSASSQFFIMHQDAPHLDGQYAAFGRVISGMEVVDEIATTPTDQRDMPLKTQIIKKMEVIS